VSRPEPVLLKFALELQAESLRKYQDVQVGCVGILPLHRGTWVFLRKEACMYRKRSEVVKDAISDNEGGNAGPRSSSLEDCGPSP